MNQARRNKDGKIVKPAAFQSHVNSGTQSRLEPSRAWFSNTKVKVYEIIFHHKFMYDLMTSI